MNYLDLIQKRKSIREFKDRQVPMAQISELKDFFSQCHRLFPEIDVELLNFDKDARQKLEGRTGYQGFLVEAPRYLAVMSEKTGYYRENAGYICEEMILKLGDMGLDSCWLNFEEEETVKNALGIVSDKLPAVIIAYGYGISDKKRTQMSIKSPSSVQIVKRDETMVQKISVDDLVYSGKWGQPLDWEDPTLDEGLNNAFYAASLSPSYLNRQPYRFILDSGMVILVLKEDALTSERNSKLNCGALMMNFEAGLTSRRPEKPQWVMGSPGQSYEIPDTCHIAAYCRI